MAMLITRTNLTPATIGELSYYGIVNLLQYITASGPYTKKKANMLEQQIDPSDFAKMFRR